VKIKRRKQWKKYEDRVPKKKPPKRPITLQALRNLDADLDGLAAAFAMLGWTRGDLNHLKNEIAFVQNKAFLNHYDPLKGSEPVPLPPSPKINRSRPAMARG
jgi:hypothetical protein